MPSTDQVTAELGAPSARAENFCALRKRTTAEPGDVVTSDGIFSIPLVHPVAPIRTKHREATPGRLDLGIALSQVSTCTHLRPKSSAPIPAEEWESSGSGKTPTAKILYTLRAVSREVSGEKHRLCHFGTPAAHVFHFAPRTEEKISVARTEFHVSGEILLDSAVVYTSSRIRFASVGRLLEGFPCGDGVFSNRLDFNRFGEG